MLTARNEMAHEIERCTFKNKNLKRKKKTRYKSVFRRYCKPQLRILLNSNIQARTYTHEHAQRAVCYNDWLANGDRRWKSASKPEREVMHIPLFPFVSVPIQAQYVAYTRVTAINND